MPHRERLVAPILLLSLACALSPGLAVAQEAPAGAEAERLERLSLKRDGADWAVTFGSSRALALVGVQPDPDGSVVVQLPNHRPSSSIRDLFPDEGPVLAVRITVEETARGPLTKAVITPRVPSSYSFFPEGAELKVRFRPRGAPSASEEAAGLGRRLAALERELTASRQERDRLRARVDSLSADRELLAGRFEQLEVRRRDLEAALEATLQEIQALAAASRAPSGSEEIAAIRRERDDLAQRVAELTGDLDRARVALEESEAQLQVWRAELDRVEQGAPVTGDERALEQLQRRLAAVTAERDQLESRLASARTAGISRGRTRGGVHLRRGPGTDTDSLTLLPEGVSLEVLGRQGDWVHVRTGSREGWVYGLLIELESETVSRLQTALSDASRERDELRQRLASITDSDTRARLQTLESTNASLQKEIDRLRNEGIERASTLSEANLREGPGLDLPVRAALRPGTTVEVLDRNGDWILVRAGQDEGWIYEKLLQLESEVIARLRGEIQQLRSEREAARAQPTAPGSPDDSELARRLAIVEGERDALRQAVADLRAEGEAPIDVRSGTAQGEATSETVSRGRTLTGVHLREAPSVESRSLMLIPAETTVELLGLEAGWYRVRQGTTEGWAFADLLTPVSEEISRLKNELAAARREIVRLREGADHSAAVTTGEPGEAWVLENVNLRDSPGMEGEVLGVLEAGTRVRVLEAGGAWHRVGNGRLEGWVYRDFLSSASGPRKAPVTPTPEPAAAQPPELSPTTNSPLPPATPLRGGSLKASDEAVRGGRWARTLARVFLREGPGADQESIALISEDTLIQILAEQGDWRRVVVRGTEGWMYGPLLEPLE